jgi:hypothetical protein
MKNGATGTDLNLRPAAYKAAALPTELRLRSLGPQGGIEPLSPAYKTGASPQCFPRRGMVRVAGFEPATSRFQSGHSTELSYTLKSGRSKARLTFGRVAVGKLLSRSQLPLTAVAMLCLASCAAKPLPRVETVTVKVPVPVACIDPSQIPPRPAKPAMPNDAIAALAVALGWLADWDAWGATVEPMLKACAKP